MRVGLRIQYIRQTVYQMAVRGEGWIGVRGRFGKGNDGGSGWWVKG